MPNIIEVTDFSSPALDVFARLTEGQLRRRLAPGIPLFTPPAGKCWRH